VVPLEVAVALGDARASIEQLAFVVCLFARFQLVGCLCGRVAIYFYPIFFACDGCCGNIDFCIIFVIFTFTRPKT